MINTFIVHREWLENIEGMDADQQDKVIADFVRYGTGMELKYANDPVIASLVNMLKGRIDYSKDKYAKKVEEGNRGGRPKKIDNAAILELAREGKTSAEIASILGCSKSAVDHSDGWKNRRTLQ